MKKIPLSDYVFLGTSLRYLQDLREDYGIHGPGYVLANLMSFSASIQGLNLKVSYGVFGSKGLDALMDRMKNMPENAKLTGAQAKIASDAMDFVRETLMAETANLHVFLPTEKRFDLSRLVDSPEKLLHDGVFAKLPLIAQSDFKEAARCIAFETPTSAAFLLLRATESAVRSYYAKYFKVKKHDKLMWGPMIIRLRKKSKAPKPDRILLDHLDNIRFNFRNPTDHPEKIYATDEVQDLLSLVVDVLNRIADTLP